MSTLESVVDINENYIEKNHDVTNQSNGIGQGKFYIKIILMQLTIKKLWKYNSILDNILSVQYDLST